MSFYAKIGFLIVGPYTEGATFPVGLSLLRYREPHSGFVMAHIRQDRTGWAFSYRSRKLVSGGARHRWITFHRNNIEDVKALEAFMKKQL